MLSGDVAFNPWPMKFGFANCRSIRNKGPTLCEEVKNGNFDVFGLTETHIKALDTPSFLNELTPEDFSLVYTNRENKHGGGVGSFIKSALDFKTIRSPEFSSLEDHTVSLTLDGRRMFLGVVYRPPASSVVKLFEHFLSYMGFLSSLSSSFVICSDFNFHVDTMSPTVSEFKPVIDSCCLSQYIDFPTHLHGHTLDLLHGQYMSGLSGLLAIHAPVKTKHEKCMRRCMRRCLEKRQILCKSFPSSMANKQM